MVFTANMSCHPDLTPCPADEGSVFCHSDPTTCPTREVDSPVEAGEVADEVRQKGGAPAEGVSKNTGYGIPRRGSSRYIFCKRNAILSGNRFSFSEEGTTAFRVRFLRKHNAFFRVIAFLFRRGDNCFPSPFSPLRASPFSENSVYPMQVYHNNNLSYALSP